MIEGDEPTKKTSHHDCGDNCSTDGKHGCNCSCMLCKLPPHLAFWAGVVVTGGIMFAVAFIILLVMMLKGIDLGSATTKTANTNKNTNTVTAAANDTADADTAGVAGTVDTASLRNIRGEGDYTIVEYSDTECPFCKRFHETMLQVMENYNGQVRWAYKHLPLESLHSKAPREANATECAADQGKFWEYYDLLMDRTTSNDGLPDEELFTMADDLGLDRTKFDDCLENETFNDRVLADSSEATSLGGRGTPFSVIIDKDGNIVDAIEGALPYTSVAQTLDALVK